MYCIIKEISGERQFEESREEGSIAIVLSTSSDKTQAGVRDRRP